MGKNRDPEWIKPCVKFERHFKYFCCVPPQANPFSEKDFNEFCELVDKCIEDNFDYTIEKCGTRPSLFKGKPEIIWD